MIRKKIPKPLRFGLAALTLATIGLTSTQAAFDVRLYLDIPGDALRDIDPIFEDPDWPDNPDIVDFHFSAPDFFTPEATSFSTSGFFEWHQSFGVEGTPRTDSGFDFFGLAASGILYVPVDGMYRFYVASNNESGLFLNPEGSEFLDPAAEGVEPIASEADISGGYELDPAAPETSDEFFLEAGKGYAIEMILADRTGQDWFQVGWSLDGGPVETIPAYYIQRDTRYGEASADGITSQEGDIFPVGAEGDPLFGKIGVSFEKSPEDHAESEFAWEVDAGDGFEPIEDVMSEEELARINGLNAPALAISALSAAWDLYLFRPVIDGDTGPIIELEVFADEVAPALAGVRGVSFPSEILVNFSEEVDMTAATDPANYAFSPEKTILGIAMEPNGRSVRIDIGPFDNEPLELTVSGITDLALAENEIEETTAAVNLNPFGVLAYWTFDGSSAVDSVRGLGGVLEGGAGFSDDTPFDGGDSLDLGDSSDGQLLRATTAGEMLNTAAEGDTITFSFWQKIDAIVNSSAFWAVSPSSPSSQRGAQGHVPWGNSQIYFDTVGCCGAATQRINAPISALGDDNFSFLEWHHYAFVKDGSTKSIWIDGELFLEGENSLPLPFDFTELVIGAQNGGQNSTQGVIDDFAVFADALTPEDIAAVADQTASPDTLLEPEFGELSIAEDLVDVSVVENQVATFTFVPAGSRLNQIEYVWMLDGEVVDGATGNTLEIPVVLADDGTTVSVMAANASGAFNEIQSSEVTLTVLPDEEAPEIVGVQGTPLNDRLTITFSEVMATEALADPTNYSVAPTDGGASIPAESAEAAADGLSATVIFAGTMDGATRYTLTTENLVDIAATPNGLADPTASFLTHGLATGGLTVLMYPGFVGALLLNLGEDEPGTLPEGFAPFGPGPNASDLAAGLSTTTPYFESPASGDINVNPPSVADSYAQIVFGFIQPPETGDYRFFIASDDEGQLWLSTDDDPANAELIASEPVWNGVRQYDDGTKEDNWSEPIPLEAGELYYVEARMSEGGGGDNLAVTWTFSDDGEDPPVPANGALPIPGEFLLSNLPVVDEVTLLSASPAPDGAGVLVDSGDFSVTLRDGFTDAVDPESIVVTVDGEPVEVTITSEDEGDTLISGAIPQLPPNTEVPVVITYETVAGDAQEFAYTFTTEDIPVLDPNWAVGLDEGTERGINVRSVQWNVGRGNSTAAAEEQLATPDGDDRILFEGSGVFDVVNFNQDVDAGTGIGVFRGGSPIEEREIEDTNLAEADLIDPDGNTDNFSIEATTFLALPEPGIYTMGVNSDDGFRVTSGISTAVEDSSLEIGVFSGGRGAASDAFQSTFRMIAPEAGIYAFRFIGYEGGGGASMEWYSIDDGVPYLINDDEGILGYVGRTRDPEPVEDAAITSISADAGNVTIEYTGTLQSAPAVDGPYTDVVGAASPYTFTPEGDVFLRAQ